MFINLFTPTQTPEEDWSDQICNHQTDCLRYWFPDVWFGDLITQKEVHMDIHVHATECSYTKTDGMQAAQNWNLHRMSSAQTKLLQTWRKLETNNCVPWKTLD